MTHMRRLLSIIAAGAFAHAAQAAGDHATGHESMKGDGMRGQGAQMQHGGHRMSPSAAYASRAGEPGNPAQAARSIDITMSEFRFGPERIEVKAGETVRLRVRNAGKIKHEMVVGDAAELKEHAKMMREQPNMLHANPNSIPLDPGESGELVWKFTSPGEFHYGSLIPGHFEAGMLGTVKVVN